MVRLSLVVSLSLGALISLPVLSSNLGSGLRKKVLECNISSGLFQQVSVYQTETGYVVRSLNEAGSANETPILQRELMSQKIQIPCPHSRSSCGVVYRAAGSNGWAYMIGNRQYSERGYCR